LFLFIDKKGELPTTEVPQLKRGKPLPTLGKGATGQ